MIYSTMLAIRAYMAAGYQTVVDTLAAAAGIKVPSITDYTIGWSDPFALPRYPAVTMVPDAAVRSADEQIITMPVWLFVAYRGNDTNLLTHWQLVAIDAAYEYLNGSDIAVYTKMDEATPYTPTANIAVVELKALAYIDILGGYNG